MEIFILIILVLLNGLLSMSEIALISARHGRLARLARDGDTSSTIAIHLGKDPNQFLSTIQIGITAVGILNGIIGEAALASPFAIWLQSFGLSQQLSEYGATALVVIVITYISIVLGELVPKRIGQLNAEKIARFVAKPILALSMASHPFVSLLSFSTDSILRLVGKHGQASSNITEEDIHAMLDEGSEAGIIEKHEHDMMRNIIRLDERKIGSLMSPRGDIVYLDINQPLETNLKFVAESYHSRFPVCRGGLHDILGIITAKQLFNQMQKKQISNLTEQLQPCVYVPESLSGMELLEQFRTSSAQMVFVIDEYGEIQGLVTLQDVLEAVTGELKPHDAEGVWAVQRDDGSWLLDGLMPIPELKDRLNFKAAPEEDSNGYLTLSGMMMLLLGRLPRTGDVAEWEGWRLEVVDIDGKRVDKVLAYHLPEAAKNQNELTAPTQQP